MTARSERLYLSHHALAEEILKEERRALRVGIGSARTPLGGFLLRGWISPSGRGLRRFRGSVIGYRPGCRALRGTARLRVRRLRAGVHRQWQRNRCASVGDAALDLALHVVSKLA